MNGLTKTYDNDILFGPYRKSEIPEIKIDYKGLVLYARNKGVRTCDLSNEEKNNFIIGANMDMVRKSALKITG